MYNFNFIYIIILFYFVNAFLNLLNFPLIIVHFPIDLSTSYASFYAISLSKNFDYKINF